MIFTTAKRHDSKLLTGRGMAVLRCTGGFLDSRFGQSGGAQPGGQGRDPIIDRGEPERPPGGFKHQMLSLIIDET